MKNSWWPSVETKSGAKEAAHQGVLVQPEMES
jgi:hypothetical protein